MPGGRRARPTVSSDAASMIWSSGFSSMPVIDRPAVGRVGQAVGVGADVGRPQLLAGGGVPDPQRAVHRARGDLAAVVRVLDGGDLSLGGRRAPSRAARSSTSQIGTESFAARAVAPVPAAPASREPAGSNAMSQTVMACPRSERTTAPVAASYTVTPERSPARRTSRRRARTPRCRGAGTGRAP